MAGAVGGLQARSYAPPIICSGMSIDVTGGRAVPGSCGPWPEPAVYDSSCE